MASSKEAETRADGTGQKKKEIDNRWHDGLAKDGCEEVK
jgi:hypothetical protein